MKGSPILFAFIARIAPLVARENRIRLRVPLTGLAGAERVPGTVAFLAVALGSTGFDGYGRTITWQNLVARVEAPYVLNNPGTGELLVTGLNLLGLLAAIIIVASAFLGACAIARSMVRAPRSLAPDFVLSLVPIALVYSIAHYFSLLVIQGQYAIPLLSDPVRQGLGPVRHSRLPPQHRSADAEYDLVRTGDRPDRRPHGRPRSRTRSGDRDLQEPAGRPPQPVRDARVDGALHHRRPLDTLSRVNVLAHGGTPGLVAEASIGLLVLGVFAAMWLRERRRRSRGERPPQAPMNE